MENKDIDDIEFKKLEFRSFRQIEKFYNDMKIGTILKCTSVSHTKIRIYMGNMMFAVLEDTITAKELVDNLLLNPAMDVSINKSLQSLLEPYISISYYRQEELMLWGIKKCLLLKNDIQKSS